MCRFCQSEQLSPTAVSGRGTLYTYTVATKPFHPYFVDKVPYLVAVVELPEQPALRMISNLVDIDEDDVRIGMDLEVVFQDLSPELTLPLFRPAVAA